MNEFAKKNKGIPPPDLVTESLIYDFMISAKEKKKFIDNEIYPNLMTYSESREKTGDRGDVV